MSQQLLLHNPELYSVLYFFSANWSSFFLLAIFVVILFFYWEFIFLHKKQDSWLKQNKELIAEYQVLKTHLNDFGRQVPCCKNCNKRDMHLWNFHKQLLVVRCSSCKMNYTFVEGQNQLILKVLFQIEQVLILFNNIISYRYHPLGKLLANELKLDLTALSNSATPLEIIHFTAQGEYMTTLHATKNIDIFDWEVVPPEHSTRIAV